MPTGALDWKICSRKTGLTALHVAASCGQVECVSELLTEIPAGIKSERSLGDPTADVSHFTLSFNTIRPN